ncbi:IclR family transcriptional regulator [Halorubrum sp. DTA46]|uniref:IclR family transcriptional regulator n=1 Tax=Halorubrum sp. DTA46 TaxID=3402162 RepID=UPI003AAF39B7
MIDDRGNADAPTDTADSSTDGRSTVKSVETTLDIVEYLHEQGEATMEDIVAAVDRSSSTVHRHLMTLRERGLVVDTSGEYALSLLFLTYGGRSRDRLFDSDIIDRKVQQLSDRTGERVQFMVEENAQRVYVFTYSGPSGVKTDATLGKRGPLHVSAAGKAILANLPRERIESILDGRPLGGQTENAIADPDELRQELEAVRERGYAYNDEESTEGLRAVGVPVHDGNGSVLGAFSVSGPAHRFRDSYFHEELPDLLMGAANEVELNLKYS